jgi:hypothetical protein
MRNSDSVGNMDSLKGFNFAYLLVVVVVILSVIIFLIFVSLFWPFTADDAFITFRYSENLAMGSGPTYNSGLPPIEGYTSFLWVIFMAIPHLLNLNAVYFAKCIGIFATIAYMLISFKFASRLSSFLEGGERYIPAVFVVLLLSSFYPTSVHAISGMETALFTLMLTLFLYLSATFLNGFPKLTAIFLALVGLLLGLTRPEGNLVVILGLLTVFWLSPKEIRPFLLKVIIILYLLPGALYFVWRAAYYGHLFPLPFYAKVLSPSSLPGINNVISFLRYMSIHVGILVLIGILRADSKLLPAFLSTSSLLVFYVLPNHIMGYEWRFLFPLAPFIFVIAALGLAVLWEWIQSAKFSVCSGRAFPIIVFLGICFVVSLDLLTDVKGKVMPKIGYAKGLRETHIALGKKLHSFSSDGVLAIADAGAVPYYSKWKTIDTFGLNNNHIALSGKHDPEYVFSQNPDVLILISKKKDVFKPRPTVYWERDLYKRSLQEGMVKVKTLKFSEGYYLWVMAVPESPIARYLGNWK